MEYIFRGLRAATTRVSPDVESVKKVKAEIIMHDVSSQKELPFETRLGIAQPYFEQAKEKNGKPMPVGTDLILYSNIMEWFGGDVLASLIDSDLVEPNFDFGDRKRSISLSTHLRKLAKQDGWKS